MREADHTLLRRIIVVVLLGTLALAAISVLRPFLVPVAWAAILAYTSWPLFSWLLRRLGGRINLASLLMTTGVAIACAGPMLLMAALAQLEVRTAYEAVKATLASGTLTVPESLAKLPFVGDKLVRMLGMVSADPAGAAAQLAPWLEARGNDVTALIGGAGRNVAKFGLALFTVFFLFRNGEQLLGQTRQVLHGAIGPRVDHYLDAVGATTRAVVFGLVLTALAQGTLAGLGYWVAGVSAPVLLGALTALLAFIPFGAPLVWLPIALWLLFTGDFGAGVGLLLWGALVVSWVDNLIRPLVISNATDIPFLLVMFGVLGGLATFGLIGVFLGPVVLAVMLVVWREWLGEA